jgi:hypothetical protein
MVPVRLLAAILVLVFTLPAYAAETEFCHQIKPAPTTINVNLELPKPYYDLKQSIQDINKDNSDNEEWLKKNGMQKVWRSEDMTKLGYAEGGAAMMVSVQLQVKNYDMYGVYYCPFVTHIDVAMIFRTRIVIPKEIKKGGCRFKTVLEHELLHYQANGEVAIEFVEKLERDLPIIVAETEKMQPYVLGADVKKRVEDIKASLKDAIEVYVIKGMSDEMERRNSLIDTPAEYAAAGDKILACRN